MEISLDEIRDLILAYLSANRAIPVTDPQERQGNSKQWEKDLAEFCRSRGYEFTRNDQIAPDYGEPLNFDVKTIRIDRTTKTFTVAPLTEQEALTGVLPYRIVVLIWRYDTRKKRGYPVDAIIVPKEAKTVLTNWSYKGIQVKSGVSDGLIRERGLLAGKRL
jgi:hypothetical protein